MSFRLKTILGVGLIEAFLLSILIVSGLYYLTSSNERELVSRADTTAKLVATMTADAVIAFDLATLDSLVEQTLRNPDLVYLRIRSRTGAVMTEGGNAAALSQPFQSDIDIASTSEDHRFDVSEPILAAGTQFGTVELGLSTESLKETRSEALQWMASIAITELLLVALLGFALGQYLTRQLDALREGAGAVAGGAFGHLIDARGKDELAETAHSFNLMSQALERYSAEAEAARKTAEAGRDRAESVLRDAVDSMPEAVAIIDADDRIVLTNHVMRKSYDLDNAEIEDAHALFAIQAKNIIGAQSDHLVAERLRHLHEPSVGLRRPARLKDGRHLLVAQHGLTGGGGVMVETDVTELMNAHEQNRHLQQEVSRRQKTEALGTLGAGIAHEINTPIQALATNLNFITGSLEDMSRIIDDADAGAGSAELQAVIEELDWSFLREEIPGSVVDMQGSVSQVMEIVRTFREVSRHESNDFKPVDLRDAVQETVKLTRHRWKDVAEVSVIASDDTPTIICDVSEICQVVLQMLDNAVDAVTLTPEFGRIDIRMAPAAGGLTLTIEDNGCGIEPANLSRIYDLMFTTKPPQMGTGGGLALCQTIIESRHNGSIEVTSNPGEGTHFTIFLPSDPNDLSATPTLNSSVLAAANG